MVNLDPAAEHFSYPVSTGKNTFMPLCTYLHLAGEHFSYHLMFLQILGSSYRWMMSWRSLGWDRMAGSSIAWSILLFESMLFCCLQSCFSYEIEPFIAQESLFSV